MFKDVYFIFKKIKVGFCFFALFVFAYMFFVNIYSDIIKFEYDVYINEGEYNENNTS